MKTFLTRFLISTILLLSYNIAFAQQVVINVDVAGTLPDKIVASKKNLITDLKLTGKINGTDVRYIREMAGVDYYGHVTEGQLINLDLSEVKIVSGGNPYYYFSYTTFYTNNDEIGVYMFNSSKLQTILLPNSITSIAYSAFSGCSRLTSVTIPNSVTSIGTSAFSGCSDLTSISIPNSVTSIGIQAFFYCSGLTSVTIPNSVTSIASDAFCGCSRLISLNVEEGNMSYSSLDGIIYNKSKSQLLICPNGLTGTILIPNSVTDIGASAFYGCSGLASITIGNSVTSIGTSSFYGCSRLTSISIPNSVTSIGTQAFFYCSGLVSITIGNSVTSIGTSSFYGCSRLTSISIPNSVTSIGTSAFYDCRALASITIPNSVTGIGSYAFRGCNGLTSISIPNSVTSIGTSVFTNCSALQKIYNYIKVPIKYDNLFDNAIKQNATLYVPKGSYSSYWASSGWGDFVNIKEMDDTMSGVNNITDNNSDSSTYFSIDGKHYVNPQKGLNIIKNSNGSTKKVIVR